ncbi:MAG: hypothetical protein V3R99_09750 [Thermoguttaceae bacterium]
MRRLILPLACCLVAIGASRPATAGQFEQIEKDLNNRAWFQKIAAEAFRPDSLILDSDRDPCDVIFRRTRALLDHLAAMPGAPDFSAERLALKQLAPKVAAGPRHSRRALFAEIQTLQRTIALKNPLLDFDQIIFAGRVTPAARHMCPQNYGFLMRPGGGVYVLDDAFGEKPRVRSVFEGKTIGRGRTAGMKLSDGSCVGLELDWEAGKIYFAWTECQPGTLQTSAPGGQWFGTYPYRPGGNRDGSPDYYWAPESTLHIYRADLDGENLEQLTDGPWNDFDPCVLPNGRVAFVSGRRGGYGRCHGASFPTYTLHGMMPDGSDIITLSYHETNEWQPSVSNDGMIAYTRWDYVDRDADIAHHLWLCYPDGRDPRSWHGNYPENNPKVRPTMELGIRAIPGSHKFVAVAAPHHGLFYGSLILIDQRIRDDRQRSQIKRLTPDAPFAEAEGTWQTYNYGTPWPLSEDFYLCVYTEGAEGTLAMDTRHELYLVDAFGNRIRLAGLPGPLSCLDPIPLRARRRPPAIPIQTQQAKADLPADGNVRPATITVMNVYESEFPWPAGTKIDALRVVQIYPKTTPVHIDPEVGYGKHSLTRSVLGTVPVEEDGSCRFEAPVGVPIYFQALDESGRAVQTMRSAAFVHPGEQLTCIGCHEDKHRPVQTLGNPTALTMAPRKLTPELPEWTRPVTFPRLVQPVLDKHCVACHAKEEEAASLAGDRFDDMLGWSDGYWGLVPCAWTKHGNSVARSKTLATLLGRGDGWILNGQSYSIPGQVGARASKLLPLLEKGHYDVRLSPEELHRITLWIDCNSVFYGAYHEAERQARGELVVPVLE